MSLSIGTGSGPKLPPKPSMLSSTGSLGMGNTQGTSTSSSSKLHQYFSSSQYLSSQQQLSIFIENFPIIDIESSHRSINEILPLLIRQNELLGKKCQSQVLLIRQSFTKHQVMNKQNRKVKEQVQSVQAQCRDLIKLKEVEVVDAMKEVQSLNSKMNVYKEYVCSHSTIMKQLFSSQFKKCEQLTTQHSIRLSFDDFATLALNQQKQQQSFVSLQLIEKYCKEMRKRQKYYNRIKSSVEEFCHRLIKITTVVPPEVLSKQLGRQCEQFLEIVGELVNLANGENKRKREESQTKKSLFKDDKITYQKQEQLLSVNSDSSLLSRFEFQMPSSMSKASLQQQKQTINLRGTTSSFQTILAQHINSTTIKYKQTIQKLQNQLAEKKQQLQTSKQYYQSYLINSKLQYENEKRTLDEQITIKDQMIKHFEQELEKSFALKEQAQNTIKLLLQENALMKDRQDPLLKEIEQLNRNATDYDQQLQKINQRLVAQQQEHHQQILHQKQQFEQKLKNIQQSHISTTELLQQTITKKLLMIKELQEVQEKLTQQVRQLKLSTNDKEDEIQRMAKRLKNIEEDHVKKLQQRIQQVQEETAQTKKINKQLSKTLEQLNHECLLNTTYIKQLEGKLEKKEEAIQKLNKKLASFEIEKKSIAKLEETKQQMEKKLHQAVAEAKKFCEENISLKRLVKQMKKQLEQVYLTIKDLKSIEKDREKLLLESQKSERWKEQIMKDYDQMKFEILKVEAENKNLLLEIKHYRNALKRIEMIK